MSAVGQDPARTVEFFRVLAHPTRRHMLRLIASGEEVARGAIEESTGLAPDMASYHLRVLVVADVVELRRRGRKVFYALRRDTVGEVVDRLAEVAGAEVAGSAVPAPAAGARAGSR
ncbi:ArsR/SmtB family transcription factor [Trujillonella endophytica]|uniref:DNA-binding transcriptional regulator, ArsR family n=1 Tax=Trujillonella endophytica TaxID=673521 RepID=A0A1H8UQU1_9ACTN|nr:metalloregulator ArsR/SmtB family transcription factor [Trujillella endophytica]SEP05476.1 DNA-binding transcriptional regulator, ArsR family [Trujillella endophytica]